jgi:hypothetical protein
MTAPERWDTVEHVRANVRVMMERQPPWPLFPGRWRRVVCRLFGHEQDIAYLPPRCGRCGQQLPGDVMGGL